MRFIERKKRLAYLIDLVDKGRLLSLKAIADKFECSDRTVKRLLADLREEGYHIIYCRRRKKFIQKN